MLYPYKNQITAINRLEAGDYILFSDKKGGCVNSGTVKELKTNNGTITIENINGISDETGGISEESFEIKNISLYFDSAWDDKDSD